MYEDLLGKGIGGFSSEFPAIWRGNCTSSRCICAFCAEDIAERVKSGSCPHASSRFRTGFRFGFVSSLRIYTCSWDEGCFESKQL